MYGLGFRASPSAAGKDPALDRPAETLAGQLGLTLNAKPMGVSLDRLRGLGAGACARKSYFCCLLRTCKRVLEL